VPSSLTTFCNFKHKFWEIRLNHGEKIVFFKPVGSFEWGDDKNRWKKLVYNKFFIKKIDSYV